MIALFASDESNHFSIIYSLIVQQGRLLFPVTNNFFSRRKLLTKKLLFLLVHAVAITNTFADK